MKSAYELALERSGGELGKLPLAVKAKMTEIDKVLKAKLAEAELAYCGRMAKSGGDEQQIKQLNDDYVVELASIRSQAERQKEEIRKQAETAGR